MLRHALAIAAFTLTAYAWADPQLTKEEQIVLLVQHFGPGCEQAGFARGSREWETCIVANAKQAVAAQQQERRGQALQGLQRYADQLNARTDALNQSAIEASRRAPVLMQPSQSSCSWVGSQWMCTHY
jgi:hypothetical protein